jgi:hypothetical protein
MSRPTTVTDMAPDVPTLVAAMELTTARANENTRDIVARACAGEICRESTLDAECDVFTNRAVQAFQSVAVAAVCANRIAELRSCDVTEAPTTVTLDAPVDAALLVT